jgi:hypothetical protein
MKSPYNALDLSDIRLVLLAPGGFDDFLKIQLHVRKLTFSIEHVEEHEKLGYGALSYVWGTEIFPRTAFVDGNDMSIGINIEYALRYLRHTDRARALWIDALCI